MRIFMRDVKHLTRKTWVKAAIDLLMKMKINFSKILCFSGHDYTCAASEGIMPTKQQMDFGVAGFSDYAKMYCKRCGYVYKPK